jgi:hypothetical protein
MAAKLLDLKKIGVEPDCPMTAKIESQMTTQPLDFTNIDSMEKARALFRTGKLEELYLFPLEYGGQAVPQNILYVPRGIADIKRQIDTMIGAMVKGGAISQYVAEPEYKGDSCVPSKIKIRAWHPEKPGGLTPTINIW